MFNLLLFLYIIKILNFKKSIINEKVLIYQILINTFFYEIKNKSSIFS